jgi:hypothetical protein
MAQSGQNKRRAAPANFLEALRDLSKGVTDEAKIQVTRAVTNDIPQSFGATGTLEPNQSFSMGDLAAAEKRGERRATASMSNRFEQERMVFLRSENETKAQIKAIQEEIQQIAKGIGEMAHEVQVASFQAPVSPGVYHANFFERMRSYLKALRLKVQQSKNWLAQHNARSSKRKGYWGQVAQSGTKFMLSQERYAVTSTG